MALSRRFLNLIVDNRTPGAKSLRCIDLARQLFDKTAQQPSKGNGSESKGPVEAGNQKNKAAEKASRLESILLPKPIFNFGAATMTTHMAMRCFPLAGREVLCSDQDGRTFLFDADACNVVTMPDLHKPKRRPLSLFVPSGSMDGQNDSGGGHLFIMETIPKSEARCSGQHSDQFEVIVCHKPTATYSCQLLPPPPFVRDPKFSDKCTKINSYAVINGGSEICISVEGAGTYCLDTVKHTWRPVGEWTLPFHGKVEYVPELKLWFGLSAKTQVLAAADLSTMDSQPELVKTWKELSPCKDWLVSQNAQLVNLGSGRFCIARFFHTRSLKGHHYDEDHFAVFTGVDVVPCVHDSNGNGSGSDNNSGNGYCNGSSGKFGRPRLRAAPAGRRRRATADGDAMRRALRRRHGAAAGARVRPLRSVAAAPGEARRRRDAMVTWCLRASTVTEEQGFGGGGMSGAVTESPGWDGRGGRAGPLH